MQLAANIADKMGGKVAAALWNPIASNTKPEIVGPAKAPK
jgi:hypothetical protein